MQILQLSVKLKGMFYGVHLQELVVHSNHLQAKKKEILAHKNGGTINRYTIPGLDQVTPNYDSGLLTIDAGYNSINDTISSLDEDRSTVFFFNKENQRT